MLVQAEHGGGEGARARASTAVLGRSSGGDSRTGRSGVGDVLVGEGVSRRTFRGDELSSERWARASAREGELAMQGARAPWTGVALSRSRGGLQWDGREERSGQ